MFQSLRKPAALLLVAGLSLLAFRTDGTAQDKAKPKENDAVKPVPREGNWMKRHEAFVERSKKGNVDVLFVGDSITQGWEGSGKKVWAEKFANWKPMNLGIGGDRTQHVLWRITTGKELEGIDPKLVVMMIGTNNFSSNTPEQIAEGVKAILDEFHKQKPKAKVLLLGVFPRSKEGGRSLVEKGVKIVAKDELHPKTPAVNALLAKFDDGKMVKYLDIGEKFLDDKGGLPVSTMNDYLHLTEKGYTIWADAISKTVEEMVK
jgi:lysophospholipase L1-like esterase